MSKHREQHRKKENQKQRSRWLIILGVVVMVVAIGLWFRFSNIPGAGGNARPISRLSTADFHSLAFSITEPDTIFFGHHGGLMVSRNGGKDWQPTTLQNADAMALALPLSNPQLIYAAGHNVFYKSTNGGQSWQPMTTNLPGMDIHGFTADPDNPNTVYANVAGFGLFSSQDGGAIWKQLSSIASHTNLAMGEDAQTLYAATGQAGLLRSADGGQTWAKVENILDEGAMAVAYAPTSKRLYITTLGSAAGLYVSNDNGKSWVALGLTGKIMAVAVSPLDPSHIVTVNDQGQVFASRDDGASWNGG